MARKPACVFDQIVARIAFAQGKAVLTLAECKSKATRRVQLGETVGDVCLWHALQASERLGARMTETVELLREEVAS